MTDNISTLLSPQVKFARASVLSRAVCQTRSVNVLRTTSSHSVLDGNLSLQVSYTLDANQGLTVTAEDLNSGARHLWEQSLQERPAYKNSMWQTPIQILPSSQAVAVSA